MTDAFWSGGAEELRRSLRDRYEPLIEALRIRHRLADAVERLQLETEIKAVEVEFHTQLNSVDDCWF